jgi:DNA-binding TFAR19-related protein (PDSD5 family)
LGDFLSEENDLQKMQEQQAQQQEMEERKRVMVRSILEPEARRHGV